MRDPKHQTRPPFTGELPACGIMDSGKRRTNGLNVSVKDDELSTAVAPKTDAGQTCGRAFSYNSVFRKNCYGLYQYDLIRIYKIAVTKPGDLELQPTCPILMRVYIFVQAATHSVVGKPLLMFAVPTDHEVSVT